MKCDKCIYQTMCKIFAKYITMVNIISELTKCEQPNYLHACQHITQVFNFCVYYRRKEE